MEKTLVVYFSYTGEAAKLAKDLAQQRGAELCEVKYRKTPGKLSAYTLGCLAALRMRPVDIEPIGADFGAYGRFVLVAPVWAGHPAPPMNNVISALPEGRQVEVWMKSMSGGSSARVKVATAIRRRGCEMVKYVDAGTGFSL